jgi:predicted ABC-type transport system involved in lysophospholipase L1 biosynthesis ATPase subunit
VVAGFQPNSPSEKSGMKIGDIVTAMNGKPVTLRGVSIHEEELGANPARRLTDSAARALLTQVGLGARLEHLPAKLSGGECQRVAIARALVNRPSVILADEPTGNLDERTGAEIMDLLLGVVADRGAALVLVTHSREFAERAGRRLVLSGGVLSPA